MGVKITRQADGTQLLSLVAGKGDLSNRPRVEALATSLLNSTLVDRLVVEDEYDGMWRCLFGYKDVSGELLNVLLLKIRIDR